MVVTDIGRGAMLEGPEMSTQERVYDALRMELREHVVKPDARLNIAETADRLDASIIPTREAFARLAAEGLLERATGSGFKVPGLSIANVEGDFTLVFLFLRHITEICFKNDDAMELLIEHQVRHNGALSDMRDDWTGMAEEAEQFVLDLLPLSNSPKLRSCVAAALDSSSIYRRVYYREMVEFDLYYSVRRNYEMAMRERDQAAAQEMTRIAQGEWEEKTKELCRYAWTEIFDE